MKHKYSGVCTCLHRAWESVSNGDRPHGTTADSRYTAASSGTSCKEWTKEEREGLTVSGCASNLFSKKGTPIKTDCLSFQDAIKVKIKDFQPINFPQCLMFSEPTRFYNKNVQIIRKKNV